MVHDLSAHTDGTTERMRQESGHDCITCPGSVRNLTATAHNALAAWNGGNVSDWPRLHRKLRSLQAALDTLQPTVDQHFEALERWRHNVG